MTNNIVAFREGTRELAEEAGFPIILPSGVFVHDARAAWLVEAVENWQVGTQKPRIRKGWFSASALGKSDEELIHDYLGQPDAAQPGALLFDARKLRIFDLGHDRDRSWKRYLKSAGLSTGLTAKHRKMKLNWLRLMGECDDIVVDPNRHECIVEVKTKAEYMFARLDAPDPAHILQVHAYMGGLAINQAIVLYEAKNTQAIKAFYVPLDAEVWSGIVQRLQRLRREADDHRGADPGAKAPAS